MQDLPEPPDGAASVQGLDAVAELRRLVAQSVVSVGLATEGEEGLPLGDGVEFEGVTRDTDGKHRPKRNPVVALGSESREKGVVVGSLGRLGWGLQVGTSSTDAGSQGSGMASLDGGACREFANAGKSGLGSAHAVVRGAGQVKFVRERETETERERESDLRVLVPVE